jgi:hypothetical protein
VSSDIEVFVEHHRCFGELSPFFDVLHCCCLSKVHFCCSCQNKYGREMVRLHGEGVNWRQQDTEPMALYASGGGKRHGG